MAKNLTRDCPAIEYDLRIGHRCDALNLIEQIVQQANLDDETINALAVLYGAIEREAF